MRALAALTGSEARLLLRNPTGLFMAFLLPVLLLLVQGLVIPGTDAPVPGAEALRVIDLFVPVAVAIALSSVALANYPSTIGGYRETGVLRRLDTTPVGASRVLVAQWLVSGASVLVSTVLVVLLAVIALGARAPHDLPVSVAAVVLGLAAMMSLGSVIAAVAPTAQAGYGIGSLVFMASLFTAGVWSPGPLMDEAVRDVVALTPLGAATQALTASWFGGAVDLQPFLVMAAWTAGCALIAVRSFRWR